MIKFALGRTGVWAFNVCMTVDLEPNYRTMPSGQPATLSKYISEEKKQLEWIVDLIPSPSCYRYDDVGNQLARPIIMKKFKHVEQLMMEALLKLQSTGYLADSF
jgi:hypothetical protein